LAGGQGESDGIFIAFHRFSHGMIWQPQRTEGGHSVSFHSPLFSSLYSPLFGLGLATAALAWSDDAPVDFNFKGDVQIQGDKSWAKGWGGNNLDNLWGRLNFGAEYKKDDFSSKFNIRIFPEGFGFEPVVGASYDTTGQGNLKVSTSQQSKVLINHAWVRQQLAFFSIRVGRFETRQTPSYIYGDYIDLAPNGSFGSRVAVHSATEINSEFGGMKSSLILGTNDKHLNKGFLRVYESWDNGQGLMMAVALKSNLFDKVYEQNADMLNRFTVSGHYSPAKIWGVYAETGMLQRELADDQFPVLGGVYFPAGILADKLSLEAEFVPDRQIDKADKPVLFAVYGQKKLFTRATFDVGLYSDPTSSEDIDIGTAVRFTCLLK
jgi:hypothetical protein